MKKQVTYKFDKVFGPVGSSAGLFLFLGGVALVIVSIWGFILAGIGAFIAFTSMSTSINFTDKKIRYNPRIYGFLNMGKWINISSDMYVAIFKNNNVYRAYSRSNRTLNMKTHNYEIYLCNKESTKLYPLKYDKTLDEAVKNAKKIASGLNISLKKN